MNQAKQTNTPKVLKQIKAFIHHVCSATVVEALRDVGNNITLMDVKGT